MPAQEDVLKELHDIADIMRENKGSFVGLKKEDLVAAFLEAQKQLQQNATDNIPVRTGDPKPEAEKAVAKYTGKYQREVRDIVKHGEHKVGAWKLRGVDLQMAKLFIDKANQLKANNMAFNGMEKIKPVSEDLNDAVKAMTADGALTGDELVPTGFSSELWQDFFVNSRIAGNLDAQPMPTDPFDLTQLGDPTWYGGTQNTALSSTDLATAGPVLTSKELVTEVDWSYNLDEDSVVAMMPNVRANISRSGSDTMDAFVMNADATSAGTGNINSDDTAPASDAYYLSTGQDGIRHLWIVDNTGQDAGDFNQALTDANMTTLLGLLGKYALDPTECVIVPDAATYLTMLGLTNVSTFEKYGPAATVLTGELAKYRGIPVIPTGQVSLMATDGKYTVTSAATYDVEGTISAFHRRMWKVGYRRGLTIEVDRLIQKRSLVMVASFRIAVGCRGTRSTAKHTAGGRGLTV